MNHQHIDINILDHILDRKHEGISERLGLWLILTDGEHDPHATQTEKPYGLRGEQAFLWEFNARKLTRYLSEVKKGVVPQTLWLHSEVGHTQDAKKELVSVLDFERSEDVFNTVKPTSLIRHILQIATDKDSIILDSFAGSGTTAHAVLALNKEDGGNRRFVLIECEDYVDSITAERVRRVIRGVPSAKDASLREGLGGTFSYFRLGKPMRQESLLDGSNLPDYEKLASYLFFTATGEEFAPDLVRRDRWFIGSSRLYDVFLIYDADVDALKDMALTLDVARKLPRTKRSKLVFAPTKYVEPELLHRYRITFQQLPFQIYEAVGQSSAGAG